MTLIRWSLDTCRCSHGRDAHLHYRGLRDVAAECSSCDHCVKFQRWWVPRLSVPVWRR